MFSGFFFLSKIFESPSLLCLGVVYGLACQMGRVWMLSEFSLVLIRSDAGN